MPRWFVDVMRTDDGINWLIDATYTHLDHEAARRQAHSFELGPRRSIVISVQPLQVPAPIAGEIVDSTGDD